MKILTVVGARPNFVKAACFSAAVRRWNHRAAVGTPLREVLVHTGQHYDPRLSDIFFNALSIRTPDYALHVRERGPAAQVGRMVQRLEPVLKRERPDAVVVFGDTNSTLAGAVAAVRCGIPVAHIEAGLRSFNPAMVEERNRILVDHLATWCFCPTRRAAIRLRQEQVRGAVVVTHDLMAEILKDVVARTKARGVLRRWGLHARAYLVLTVHRAENTDTVGPLRRLMEATRLLLSDGWTIIVPVHPRLDASLRRFRLSWPVSRRLHRVAPLGYADMMVLTAHARGVLTDSGGLQKEAVWLGTPCVTLRRETEWVETLRGGRNRLVGTDPARIRASVSRLPAPRRPRLLASTTARPSDVIVARLIRALRPRRTAGIVRQPMTAGRTVVRRDLGTPASTVRSLSRIRAAEAAVAT